MRPVESSESQVVHVSTNCGVRAALPGTVFPLWLASVGRPGVTDPAYNTIVISENGPLNRGTQPPPEAHKAALFGGVRSARRWLFIVVGHMGGPGEEAPSYSTRAPRPRNVRWPS